ncbi:hypothetical protein [Citrobacter braakii]|uniref:hypothetical protein n=1 Tax=Citrobacter braakii TaxID=57706 RepID=UPI0023AEEC92|nr:hypothetical protein [Citrobacter braakii]
MTTNHPAHGPVSLDRLHQIREHLLHDTQYSNGWNRAYILADMLRVIEGAIAAFDAEPVLYAMQGVNLDTDAISTCKNVVDGWVEEWNQERKSGVAKYKTVPLYTAPTAPVVPDEKPMPEASKMHAIDAVAAIAEVRGWNACRAAMLKTAPKQENI